MSEAEEMGLDESAEARPTGEKGDSSQVDLAALAERIYRLLKQEACVERERLGGRRSG